MSVDADRLMRVIAREAWPDDPSPLEEQGYSAGLDAQNAALGDVVKIIDAARESDDESAKYGADLLAAIVRDTLRKHGLYPAVER